MKNFTIIVNSCDKYEDAWNPFFTLFKLNWPDCQNHKIILNTETKNFECQILNVSAIPGGKVAWSKRLKNILETVETDIVLLFLEDFFLRSEVNQEMFNEALELISSNNDIGYIGLKYTPERIFKDPSFIPSDRFYSRDLLATKCRITAMSVLWRKDWLLELLDETENPWEFERNVSVRSKDYDYQVLEINNINNRCPVVFDFEDKVKYGYGITQGQWLPKNKELFEKYGIQVNFDNLGINYDLYEQANLHSSVISSKKKNLIETICELKEKIKNRNIKRG